MSGGSEGVIGREVGRLARRAAEYDGDRDGRREAGTGKG